MLLSQYCNQIFFSFTKVTPKSLMSFHSRLVSPIGLLFSKSIQTTPLVASLQNLNSKSSGDTFFWTFSRTCVKNLIPFSRNTTYRAALVLLTSCYLTLSTFGYCFAIKVTLKVRIKCVFMKFLKRIILFESSFCIKQSSV